MSRIEAVSPPTSPASSGKVKKEILPAGQAELPQEAKPDPQAIISRGELAHKLVQWFSLSTWPYNDFPLFVDVSRDNPNYPVYDTVYRYHLLLADGGGYFHPDEPARVLDLWVAIGKMLAPKNTMPQKEAATFITALLGGDAIPFYHYRRVTQLFKDKVLFEEKDLPLNPGALLRQANVDEMVKRLESSKLYLRQRETETALSTQPAQNLPSRTQLVITPSEVISLDQLAPGSQVFFQTTEAVTISPASADSPAIELPAGSSLPATVVRINQETHRAQLAFQQARSATTNQLYRFEATISIELVPKSQYTPTLLLTGDKLTLTTEAPRTDYLRVESSAAPAKEPVSQPIPEKQP